MCGETAGDDGVSRCNWAGSEPIYRTYHDTEWGVPEYDSRALWEKLILDGFQAGLSWLTILKKRDNFRAAFRGFNPREIATWGEDEVDRLVQDAPSRIGSALTLICGAPLISRRCSRNTPRRIRCRPAPT